MAVSVFVTLHSEDIFNLIPVCEGGGWGGGGAGLFFGTYSEIKHLKDVASQQVLVQLGRVDTGIIKTKQLE